jgi:hypothetical protein
MNDTNIATHNQIFRRNITYTMDIISRHKKGKHLNTLVEYDMYKNSENNLHVNDTNIDTHNPIFSILQEMNTS